MNRKLTYALGAIFIVIATGIIISRIFPAPAAALLQSGLRLSARLEAKTVETEIGTIHYLEGGQGDTVVFVHGIYARKEHWIDMSRAISDGYHVLLLDLPGFGENDVLSEGGYSYDAQEANLVTVLDALGVQSAHIVANSMGAQIAGMIAVDYPERVKSISFVGSPVGVTSPHRSDMELQLQSGDIPLVVRTEEDFIDRLTWLFPKPPFIPRAIMKTWAQQEAENAESNLRIWREVSFLNTPRLEELAPEISQPAIIIWCRPDRIFHVSGASVLEQALVDAELQILDDCGHVPMLDKPKVVGALTRAFLDNI